MSDHRTPVVSATPEGIRDAAALLRRGGLVAFPTETVYGLGVHALDRDAVRRLFTAKGRPATDPLIVHVAEWREATPLVAGIPPRAHEVAARFWPGPLTLVLPRSAAVPDEVTAGLDTVAIRVPAHPVAAALLDAAGIPIAAPSANLFSRPSPTQASHVLEDLDGLIDLVVDGGPTTVGVESTVLDLSGEVPRILRPGAVTLEMLRDLLPDVMAMATPAASGPMRSPGLLEKHYSPRAPLTLFEGTGAVTALAREARAARARGQKVGVMIASEDRERLTAADPEGALEIVELGAENDLSHVAAGLYAALRALDATSVDVILARAFPIDGGLGPAIADRLRRAAAGRVVHES